MNEKKIKPNYSDYGLSDLMQFNLRKIVEKQLIDDLKFYGVKSDNLQFDWSESCVEGLNVEYLNSTVENYSGISVFDLKDNLIADGWMEIIYNKDYNLDNSFFLVYWDFVTIWEGNYKLNEKAKSGIPNHIWDIIPEEIKPFVQAERIKQ